MNTTTELLVVGLLVPFVVSGATCALLLWLAPADLAERYLFAFPLGVAFVASYILLPDWAELWPTRHWHWLPYLAGAAGLFGPLLEAPGVRPLERLVGYGLLAMAAAWLLVPDWPDLKPPRPTWLIGLAAGLTAGMLLLRLLPAAILTRFFLILLAAVAAGTAAPVAIAISVRYAELGLMAAAALAAEAAVSGMAARRGMALERPLRALVPGFVVVLGGVAFVSGIEPQPPKLGAFLLPASLLGLWFCRWGPAARWQGRKAVAAQAAAVALPLTLAAGWLLV